MRFTNHIINQINLEEYNAKLFIKTLNWWEQIKNILETHQQQQKIIKQNKQTNQLKLFTNDNKQWREYLAK